MKSMNKRKKTILIILGVVLLLFTAAVAIIPAGESHVWKFWFRMNLVDICLWCVVLYMGVRYGVLEWSQDNPALFNIFLFFYGAVLIYRLGVMKMIQWELLQKCLDAGIDVSDILPPGSY